MIKYYTDVAFPGDHLKALLNNLADAGHVIHTIIPKRYNNGFLGPEVSQYLVIHYVVKEASNSSGLLI